MGKAIIDEETLTGIADAIRTKKGTSGLIPTPNIKDEILSINGGIGISDGFSVNFYENNSLVEIHSAKNGNLIEEPFFSKKMGSWKDSNGDLINFPMTKTNSVTINAYFENYSLLEKFYKNFEVDTNIYPYLYIVSWFLDSSTWRIKPIFCKSIQSNGLYLRDCLLIQGNNHYDKSITSEEYNNETYYSDASKIFDVLRDANVVFNSSMSEYITDNDTNKCWYFSNYDTTLHTNWTDLRTL